MKDRLITIWCLSNAFFYLILGGLPCIIFTMIMYPFANQIFIEKFVSYWSSVYFKLVLWSSCINIQVHGLENMPKNKKFILASNHTSFLDIPLLYAILPYWITPVVKKDLIYVPIFGLLVRLSGAILIDRKNTAVSIDNMNNTMDVIKNNPRPILIFPEGKRSLDSNIQELKPGAFIMSVKLKYPIVPVYIHGCNDVIGKNLNIFGCINTSKTIHIYIGTQIDPEELDKDLLKEKVFCEMSALQACKSGNTNPKQLALSFCNCFVSS